LSRLAEYSMTMCGNSLSSCRRRRRAAPAN
jgi:hypothetical protein